jgi:hypothetical protein
VNPSHDDHPRFEIVFKTLRDVVADECPKSSAEPSITIEGSPEVTSDELEEIEALRRAVLEVSDPEPMSFTTT